MVVKILMILIVVVLGIAGLTIVYAAQYLYKEKFIKSGLREGLYNTSVDDYPENKDAQKLMKWGQILIVIDLLLIFIFGSLYVIIG